MNDSIFILGVGNTTVGWTFRWSPTAAIDEGLRYAWLWFSTQG